MDSQARVASLDRVAEFRSAYAKFGDSARQVLLGVDLEIRRMLEWLEKDQVAYWKGEIRRREEKLNEAKGALHRKRITAAFGNTVGDTDEIIQVRKAKARLEEAEEKLKAVKQWAVIVEQEVTEYRAPAQVLGNILDGDVPRALASLERTLQTLESYVQTSLPAGAPLPSFAAEGVGIGDAASSLSAPAATPPSPSVPSTQPSDVAENAP